MTAVPSALGSFLTSSLRWIWTCIYSKNCLSALSSTRLALSSCKKACCSCWEIISARTSLPSPSTSYELPQSSLSALCRTYLEDIRIVLGSALAVLVRSPNPRFDLDMADLISPLNNGKDNDYLTRSLLTRSNLLLQSVQISSPAGPVSPHFAAERHAGSFSWPYIVCPDGSDP